MSEGVLNFRLHGNGILATGGKPDTKEKLEWLLGLGVRCIISLEGMPNGLFTILYSRSVKTLFKPLYEDQIDALDSCKSIDDFRAKKVLDIFDLIAECMFFNKPVFVHCSAGINRSRRLVEIYLYYERLFTTHLFVRRAYHLQFGDDTNEWDKAHYIFCHKRFDAALNIIEEAVTSTDEESCSMATETMRYLIPHIAHQCFSLEEVERLKKLGWDLNLC